MFAQETRPTARLAESDVQTIGALTAIRHTGLRMPADVAIMSVAQAIKRTGAAAVEHLIEPRRTWSVDPSITHWSYARVADVRPRAVDPIANEPSRRRVGEQTGAPQVRRTSAHWVTSIYPDRDYRPA